ncbi:MAG: formimidoylglutamate deiminase [Acidobacteriota bacterium]|nr:formimidoylglutamate deiminase [Acidobacteriota bacterium]
MSTQGEAPSAAAGEIWEADLTWTGRRFETGVRLEIGASGSLLRVGQDLPEPHRRLRRRALLPGFVNAHSHAFQRGLRGLGETFPQDAGSFWTWRRAMYGLVADLDADRLHRLCLQAFREMLAAGITTVGEFHYVHHLNPEPGDDFTFDEVVLRAAAEAGIRIVLLQAYYATGGVGQPLEGAQRRFRIDSLERYWQQMDHLAGLLEPRTQSLGAVAHSLRAAPPDAVQELHAEARRRKMVLHLHVEEQRQEVDAVVETWGRRPLELLLEHLPVGPGLTAVHCTHTPPAHLRSFAQAGANVCICPLTEANLGDGIASLPALQQIPEGLGALCLGTDSNARISMLEEMRWLEYVQRLHTESRGVLRNDHGDIAPSLLHAATRAGATALGLPTGQLVPGAPADLILVDLDAPQLAELDENSLAAGLVLGAGDAVIREVCVGGRWVIGNSATA